MGDRSRGRAKRVLSEPQLAELLQSAYKPILEGQSDVHALKNLIAGTLRAIADDKKRNRIIKATLEGLPETDIVGFLSWARTAPRTGSWSIHSPKQHRTSIGTRLRQIGSSILMTRTMRVSNGF